MILERGGGGVFSLIIYGEARHVFIHDGNNTVNKNKNPSDLFSNDNFKVNCINK